MPRHLEAQKGDHAWFCRLCPWHTEENPRLGGNMPNFRNEALRHVHTQLSISRPCSTFQVLTTPLGSRQTWQISRGLDLP